MTPTSVKVQISPESVPSTPSWFGEVTMIAHVFTQRGLLAAIVERVRFARAKFGTYDTIDFVVVLLGYAVSGELTLKAFYERLQPFGKTFMSLFERADLPSHSALSRYLAALDRESVEALRTLFQEDLGASQQLRLGGLYDRTGKRWKVTDVDATREAARQRALPHGPDLPLAHRRMDAVCAPGYSGRKRGEVVRSRTVVLQAHTQSLLGTFGEAGNGDYRGELLRAIEAISSVAQAWSIPLSSILIRLDGLYGDAAPLIDCLSSGLGVVVRGRNYAALSLPSVQARLVLPPDAWTIHPESGVQRALFDCPEVPLGPSGPTVRMIVAVHQAGAKDAPIGITKQGLVYEIFLTSAPQEAFTPVDVLHLYLHRGAFETALAHEDQEQDPDRWVSHTHWGQECWQILSQWIWNTRLELGQHLEPIHLRLTELVPEGVGMEPSASALLQAMASHAEDVSVPTKAQGKALTPFGYGPLVFSARSGRLGYAGTEFALQPDGTLRCPDDKPLYPQGRKLLANGSLRLVYAARIAHCRTCPLRLACQGSDKSTLKARRVTAICLPLSVKGSTPLMGEPTQSGSVETENAAALGYESGAAPPASPSSDEQRDPPPMRASANSIPAGYGPPTFSASSSHTGFAGNAFSLQADGTLLCPAEHPLSLQEQIPLSNGALRLIYGARMTHCRSCPLRLACQGSDKSSLKARRVHAICQPLSINASTAVQAPTVLIEPSTPAASSIPDGLEPPIVQAPPVPIEPSTPAASSIPDGLEPATIQTATPVLWEDWPASHIRQQWMGRLRTETVHVAIGPPGSPIPMPEPRILTRAQRAHWRLSWKERFARNARREDSPALLITLHGLPDSFAQAFALDIAA